MSKFQLVPLTKMADIFDHLREPVSQAERNKRIGSFPYYGATGQIGTIDDYKQEGKYVLLGEDGAPFLEPNKVKAYIVEGKCWVNNHAHVLKGKEGICDDDFLCYALNYADYSNAVTGSTRLKLPQNMMGNLLIPKPTLKEQKTIAQKYKLQLSEIKKTREAVELQLKELDQIKVKLQEKAMDILKDVPRLPLEHFLEGIEAGKSIKTTELPAKKDELGVLKVSAVSWNKFQSDEAKSVYPNYKPQEHHRVKQGDLIISRANTIELVGAVVLVEQDYPNRLLSDKTLRLIIANEKEIYPEFLLHVLKLPEARNHIEENATGTSDSMRNISQKTINKIPVPDANSIKQKEIIKLFEDTSEQFKCAEDSLKIIFEEVKLLPSKLLNEVFELK